LLGDQLPADRAGEDLLEPFVGRSVIGAVERGAGDVLQPGQQAEAEQVAEREADDRGAVRVGVVGLDLRVGAVAQKSFEHRGDLGRGAGRELAVNAQLLFLDVPVDHHAVAAVAGVELGHQVGVPGAEPLGVGGGRGRVPPPPRMAVLERGVDDANDRRPEVVAVDVGLAGAPERGGLAVLAGGDELGDPQVGSSEDWYRKPV